MRPPVTSLSLKPAGAAASAGPAVHTGRKADRTKIAIIIFEPKSLAPAEVII